LAFDIEWPPGTAYAYLLDADEPVLVDAGGPGEAGREALASGLAGLGFEPADVEHLLVTHPHTDHDGQIAALVEAGNPTVYAPAGVRDRLERDADDLAATVRENARAAGVPDVDTQVDRAVDSLERNRACLPPEHVDVSVAGGDHVRVGNLGFEAVHVPGHQENQLAFLVDGLLFAGDTAVEPFRPAALHVGFDAGCRDAIDAFYDGLDALAAVEHRVERVFPGHGPVFTDLAATIQRDERSLDQVVASTRDAVAALDAPTADEVTRERVADLDGREYTVFESVGALAALERQGVLRSTVDAGRRRYHPA
jgi:glyoxylase-like metal-dependent hydrolase (beta-lactamase superfamily II)